MKIVRHLWIVVMLLPVLMIVMACGSDKYSEAQALYIDHAKATEDYVSGLESAQNADDAAAAIDRYTDNMKELIPRIKALQKQHPELREMHANRQVPEELQEATERLEAATEKVQGATMNMMKYMMDPKVQKAMQRMGQELKGLGS